MSRAVAVRPRPYYGWVLVATLGITETVSWGVLYYTFGVLVAPMERELGWSRATLSGGFSLALLVAGVAAVPVGRWLDRRGARVLMTAGSCLAVAVVLAWSQVRQLNFITGHSVLIAIKKGLSLPSLLCLSFLLQK